MKTKQKNRIIKKKRTRRKTPRKKKTQKIRKRRNIQKGGNVGLITNELNNELQDYYFDEIKNMNTILSVLSTSSEMNIDDLLENMRDE